MPNLPRAFGKLAEIRDLAELGKGRTHDDHEVRRPLMRKIRREVERAVQALESEEPSPPVEAHPALFVGDFLHPFGGEEQIAYENTTLGAPGDPLWNDPSLQGYFNRYSHLLFYAEANENLWGLLGKEGIQYSFYDYAELGASYLRKVRSFGGEPWVVAMDQDTPRYQAYANWKAALFRFLDRVHVQENLLRVLMTGIEINSPKRWGAHPDWVDDMHRELKARYPGLLLAVHFLGPQKGQSGLDSYRRVPDADIYALQLRWESYKDHEQAGRDLRQILPAAKRDYDHVVVMEYAQHERATESNASQLHTNVIAPELERAGLPITGGCGLS